MSLIMFPEDNKGPPCFAELQFKKSYPSVSLLNLDSRGLIPILLVQPCGCTISVHRNGNMFRAESKNKLVSGSDCLVSSRRATRWEMKPERLWLAPAGKCQALTGNQSSTHCWHQTQAPHGISAHVIVYMLILSPPTSRFVTFVKLGSS